MGHTKALNVLREQCTRAAAAERSPVFPRRRFLKILSAGTGTVIALGGWLVKNAVAQDEPTYSLVAVELNRCTGCRTCEAVCSRYTPG